MRVLHLIKTTEGARWAVEQVTELVKLGVDVHAALPDLEGRLAAKWKESGACFDAHCPKLSEEFHRNWVTGMMVALSGMKANVIIEDFGVTLLAFVPYHTGAIQ